jgi:hypothetical protein
VGDDRNSGADPARRTRFGLGLGAGVAIGITIGAALHNVALGVALGAGIGVALGAVWRRAGGSSAGTGEDRGPR